MKRSRAGVSKRKFIVHWPTSVWITPPGRTPGHVPTPTGSLPSAAGTPISEHLAPPSVNDDALTAAGWFCVDAVPDPAEAASGMTSAASTPSTGISLERRILNPPLGAYAPFCAQDCRNQRRIRFDIGTIRTCLTLS